MKRHQQFWQEALSIVLDPVPRLSIRKDANRVEYISNPTVTTIWRSIRRLENRMRLPEEVCLSPDELQDLIHEMGLSKDDFVLVSIDSCKRLANLAVIPPNMGEAKRKSLFEYGDQLVALGKRMRVWPNGGPAHFKELHTKQQNP